MGKKGSKRKTRWRTLSIGAPPGEEDEEEGLRNGYIKGQENSTSTHSFDRNGQGYKPRKTATGSNAGGNGGARSHKDETSGSPSQPKVIFNEDEYTRITTPRQDVLFKKGYLSRKKPWACNASTSATPSTTESQSASHSTADGSETTEDQQWLDRDSGTGEYPPMVESGTQLGYGTFYDHTSGYYYEYPVMLVGPPPVPAQVGPSVLAAVPCGPVPLRPIEWVNPAFVPKLAGQPYCEGQNSENSTVVEQETTLMSIENSNGYCNESGTGSICCNGSVTGEIEEQSIETNTNKEQQDEQPVEEHLLEEHQVDEQQVEEQPLENGVPYMEPVLMQQPVHVSHHVIPPQPYMYPGHYMFGPPLVNVNGVTIQSGHMVRTIDVAAMMAACSKRRKKKKRRKQKRPALGNTEDEEEGEYSSECDTGLPSSRLSWTECPTSIIPTTTTTNRPLNPECQEFQLRTVVEPHTSLTAFSTSDNTTASDENSITNQSSTSGPDAIISDDKNNEACNGAVSEDSKSQVEESVAGCNSDETIESRLKSNHLTSFDTGDLDNEADRLRYCLAEKEDALLMNETNETTSGAPTENEAPPNIDINKIANDISSANETCGRSRNEVNGINSKHSKEIVVNGKFDYVGYDGYDEEVQMSSVLTGVITSRPSSSDAVDTSCERICSRSSTPKDISTTSTENDEVQENFDPSSNVKSSGVLPKRKYSVKGIKFVREPTPGPDLDSVTNLDLENEKITTCDKTHDLESIDLSNGLYAKPDSSILMIENTDRVTDQTPNRLISENVICNYHPKDNKVQNDETIEGSNEDSGFESQTRLSDYPITEAVTEWLRRVNSPDIFITSAISSDSETEDEDELDEKPPKNLQGNPMPALSANNGADNVILSRTTSCGEFARTSNIKNDVVDGNNGTSAVSRKKRDTKCTKKRSGERIGRRVRHVEGTQENEIVSSSDSCSQQDESVSTARKKNLQKQDVGDVCEFTEKDSVAGMRVALCTRMDSKRVNARRTKRQGKINREPVDNIDIKIRSIEDVDNENDEGIVEDTVNVRTFEKGEIIVSEDGKLLTTSSYEPILYNSHNTSIVIKTVYRTDVTNEMVKKLKDSKRHSIGEDENGSVIIPFDSIEEPDVLECWEAETIEPVITPKRMLQSRGILCDGEAAEDDNFEAEQANVDYVQKYYRLARESATSIEEEGSESKTNVNSSASRTVPNNSEQMIESFCSEEIPVVVSNGIEKGIAENKEIPIDEAFEVYESCYTGKSRFSAIDSKVFKPRTLYGQDGEGPIRCRAVCCNIQ